MLKKLCHLQKTSMTVMSLFHLQISTTNNICEKASLLMKMKSCL
jgi:hypothetical protein